MRNDGFVGRNAFWFDANKEHFDSVSKMIFQIGMVYVGSSFNIQPEYAVKSRKLVVGSDLLFCSLVPSFRFFSPIKGRWHHKQIATKGFMVDSSHEHVCEHK